MAPVRILYLIAQLGAGGTESQLLHLLRRLDRDLYSPEVVTFTAGGALRREFQEASPVKILPKSRFTEPLALLRLVGLLRRRRPAILHTLLFPSNWRGALAGRLATVPVVIGSVRNVSTWMGPASRAVERAATSLADAVVVNAEAVGRFMIREVGAREDRLRLIPNGVDLQAFSPRDGGASALRSELWGRGERIVVGAVMSLSTKKNPYLLLESAARVIEKRPDARFLIAGEGPLRAGLEERIRGLDLDGKVKLLGVRRDVPEILRSLDLLTLTSDREGCPNVVLEAMATGLPVAATAVGGTPDLVEDGVSGRLVPPGDGEALAAAILDILSDPARTRGMGEAGLRRAREGFGMESMVRRTTGLYEELTRRAAAGQGETG